MRADDVLEFIIDYAREHGGNSPSTREIGEHFGFTQPRAVVLVHQLKKRGEVSRKDGKLMVRGGCWYLRMERQRTRWVAPVSGVYGPDLLDTDADTTTIVEWDRIDNANTSMEERMQALEESDHE